MSSAKDKVYDRVATLKSFLSGKAEIHAFGYGLIPYLAAHFTLPTAVQGAVKTLLFGLILVLYGYRIKRLKAVDGSTFNKAKNVFAGGLDKDDLPHDIVKAPNYYVLGVGVAAGVIRALPYLPQLL